MTDKSPPSACAKFNVAVHSLTERGFRPMFAHEFAPFFVSRVAPVTEARTKNGLNGGLAAYIDPLTKTGAVVFKSDGAVHEFGLQYP